MPAFAGMTSTANHSVSTEILSFRPLVGEDPDVLEEFLTLLGQTADHHRVHAGFGFVEANRYVVVCDEDRATRIIRICPPGPGVSHPFGEYDETSRRASIGFPDTGIRIIRFLRPRPFLSGREIGLVRARDKASSALTFHNFVQFPDNASHPAVDATVVKTVGQGGMEVRPAHV